MGQSDPIFAATICRFQLGYGRIRACAAARPDEGQAEQVELTTVVILSVLAALAIVFILCADRLQVG
jgi:hypothetical protein